VAFFTDTFEPTNDGVAKVTGTLARALGRAGHEVTIFTVRAPGLLRSELGADGLRIHRVGSVPAPRYPQYRVAVTPWWIPFSRGRFDVVHIHTPGFVGLAGWLAAGRWGVPTVATYHTNLTDMLRGAGSSAPARAFFRSWSRFSLDLCRRSDLATAPSEAARSMLRRSDAGAASGPEPRWVPNGIDVDTFRPGTRFPDWRARLDLGDRPLITFLGRLTRDKGIERFLSALERLPGDRPWGAVVGGEGPLRGVVEGRLRDSERLASRVRFVGAVAEAEKPALLAQSHIFVLPSLSDTSSVALLEAMAAGAPGVVTRFGGPAEIALRSSAGLLVDPRDPDELAAAIERLLSDAELRGTFSERGRSWVVANASADRMVEAFVGCYRSVIDRVRTEAESR
jgi:1,2-diacylglycerol 3-alpha-glucosyltransferase